MLSLRLAIRFIFSPKSSSIVNLIAVVSAVALSLAVAASLFTVSLQDGLEKFVFAMYADIDPLLRVERVDGKQFDRHILEGHNVGAVSVRKDVNVVMECGKNRVATVISGVDSTFCSVTGIDDLVSSGRNPIPENNYGVLLGRGIAYELGIASGVVKLVKVSSIKKHAGLFSGVPVLRSVDLLPVGVYSLDQETDSRYAFAPISRIDELTGDSLMVSSLEILPSAGVGKEDIVAVLPDGFAVKDRADIRSSLFAMVSKEKYVVLGILMMIALLSSMSLAGTVSVMIREKSVDSGVLMVLGYPSVCVRRVFFLTGFLLSLMAVTAGMVLGLLLTLAQSLLGFLSMGGTTFLIDSYPVYVDPLTWTAVITVSALMGALVSAVSSYCDKNVIFA